MELIPICEKDLKLASTVWYALSPTGSIPSMRVGHTAVYMRDLQEEKSENQASGDFNNDDQGSIYVFGGANPRECFDQIHRLDLNTHQWSLLVDKSIGTDGRYEHACFNITNDKKIYIFGGANLQTNLNDLICFDLDSNSVETVKTEGKILPKERTLHTGAVFKKRLIVFGGGSDGRRALEDTQVYLFDIANRKWLSLPMNINKSGDHPGTRQGHVMINIDDESVYLHGGMDGETFYDDLWLLDFDKFSWTKKQPQSLTPSARAAHAGVGSGKHIFIFGGLTSVGQASDELWKCHTGKFANLLFRAFHQRVIYLFFQFSKKRWNGH